MSKIITFDDGSIYYQRPGSRWGRVKMSTDDFLVDASAKAEVCYIPVSDITPPPVRPNKGSTMIMDRSWFDYLDKAHNHTPAASNWMRTIKMLWCNRPYVGDPSGSTLADGADPEPVIECITGTGNILRVIGETESHYEIYALPMGEPGPLRPEVFNWFNYPWIFWKAQARKRDGSLINVGDGLHVFHVNFRKATKRHYIHKSLLDLFTLPPFTVSYEGQVHTVVDYQFLGADIYGITNADSRIPLLQTTKYSVVYPTEWRGPGRPVNPP